MPTYEFTCPNGHDFEKFFRTISGGVSELPCPVCGAIAVRKISAGAGLMFKGTGFYITDYGKDGKKDQHLPRKSSNGSDGASPSASASSDSGDSKSSGESKASESSSSEAKSSSSDSKPAESKPAPKPAEKKSSAPKSSNSSE
jgi:putative FmdB family regulatory protein